MLAGVRSRRHVFAGVLAAALTSPAATDARKKCKEPRVNCRGKCCRNGRKCIAGRCAVPCRFDRRDNVMRLRANCWADRFIEIPDGVTLDGNGKTIKFRGSTFRFVVPGSELVRAGIFARSGRASVKNLSLSGARLKGGCVYGLAMKETAGSVTGLSVYNMCHAIRIEGSMGQEVSLTRVNVERTSAGIHVIGNLSSSGIQAAIDECDLSNISGIGILIINADAAISKTGIQNAQTGVIFEGASTGSVDESQIENVSDRGVWVYDTSTVDITGTTIVGRGARIRSSFGVDFAPGAAGTVDGNAISNFKDTSPGETSCGIRVDEDVSDVQIGANTFPPPGPLANEVDICDYR
jgi:hypothetical protein